jgi:competence ComEA-like helix-hairpin-helix protein
LSGSGRRVIVAAAGLTVAFLLFTGGFFLGRRQTGGGYTVVTDFTVPALPPAESSEPTVEPKIDINTASAAELETLSGIGPALAAAIIEYRESVGGFKYTFELLDVKGIGKSLYERIENSVEVVSSR